MIQTSKLKKMGFYIFAFILFIFVLIIGFGFHFSEKGYTGESSEHFNGKIFINPNGKKGNGFKEVLKYISSRKPAKWTENYETYVRDTLIEDNLTDSIKLIFVNHSTFLIQMDSLNILTDPIWSYRCSPIGWIGPKRNRPAGVAFNSLPNIDLVLISHNHYDHLDKKTILRIQEKHQPKFIVPLGVSHFFKSLGIENVVEMDWEEEIHINTISIIATPAIHFSSRGLFDRDNTLWCGFIIKGSKKIYYAGDTAYDEHIFKEIGTKNPNIEVALIPIGAYKPSWFMSPIHTNPDEAVKIHLDTKSKNSLAAHFGTFALADEGQGEAGKDLNNALTKHSVSLDEFIVPDEGIFYSY